MIIFLHGEDEFLVLRRKRALVQAFTKKYPAGEVFTFDFEDQGRPEDVKRALGACEGGRLCYGEDGGFSSSLCAR